MSAFESVHPRALAYAVSAIDDALLERRQVWPTFYDVEGLLISASIARELPDSASIDPENFLRIWNLRAADRLCEKYLPLEAARLVTLPLATPRRGKGGRHVTVVSDVQTLCIAGIALHVDAVDHHAAVRALNSAIAVKHAHGRRLPGCVHAWPCAGIPRVVELAAEHDMPRTLLWQRCRELDILPSPIGDFSDADAIQETLSRALHDMPLPRSADEVYWAEQALVRAIVDDLNQRRMGDGPSPHHRWVAGMHARNAIRKRRA